MAAEVAIYFSLGKEKAVKNAPLKAPPVPIKPARKPDNPPPIIELKTDSLTLNSKFLLN